MQEATEAAHAALVAADASHTTCPSYEDADWSNALFLGGQDLSLPPCVNIPGVGDVRVAGGLELVANDNTVVRSQFPERDEGHTGVASYNVDLRWHEGKPSFVVGSIQSHRQMGPEGVDFHVWPPWHETNPKTIRVLTFDDSLAVAWRTAGVGGRGLDLPAPRRTAYLTIMDVNPLPHAERHRWLAVRLGDCVEERVLFLPDETLPPPCADQIRPLDHRGGIARFLSAELGDNYGIHVIGVDSSGWSSHIASVTCLASGCIPPSKEDGWKKR